LNLVVFRVADIERSAAFYRLLGLEFVKHAHGSGPQHFASETGGIVFELYPASAEQPVCVSTRVGFLVDDVDDAIRSASVSPGCQIVGAPNDSPWDRRAVLTDPDGHRVELLQSNQPKGELDPGLK
jgi:predicted enzyme related to lactoylglutathione lyase